MLIEPSRPAIRPGQRCRCRDRLSDLHPVVVALRPVDPEGLAAQIWVVADGEAVLVCAAAWLEPIDAGDRGAAA